jgi:hypothetical protein
MTLALHFLKRDIRHTRWMLVVWSTLLAIDGFNALLPAGPTPQRPMPFIAGYLLIPMLRYVTAAILVALVVQEDPLVGTTAFWLTRPVGRGVLFLSKLAYVGVVISIPLLIDAFVLARFGLPPGEFGLALAQVLMRQLLLLVPLALLAALTPNLFRYFTILIVLVAVLSALSTFVTPHFTAGGHGGPFVFAPVARARDVIAALLTIGGAGLVMAHQYLTRRTGRSVALASSLVAAQFLVAWFWPWSFESDGPLRPSPGAPSPGKIELQVMTTALDNVPFNVLAPSAGKNIDGPYILRGLPPELFARVRSVTSRLIGPSGAEIETAGTIPTLAPSSMDPPATAAISAALGGIPVSKYVPSPPQTTFVTLGEESFARYRKMPVTLVADLDLVVSRYQVVTEMPVEVGSHYDAVNVHCRVDQVLPRSGGVTIDILECTSDTSFRAGTQLASVPADPRLRGDPVYVLLNRPRREAALLNPLAGSSITQQPSLGGLIVQRRIQISFGGDSDFYGQFHGIDRNWLVQATLARLERVPVAEFEKTVTVHIPILGEPWSEIGVNSDTGSRQRSETTPMGAASEAGSNGPSLPNATNGRGAVLINIVGSGSAAVNGEVVNDQQLATRLESDCRLNRHASILVVFDNSSSYKRAAFILGLCRRVGFTHVVLQSR